MKVRRSSSRKGMPCELDGTFNERMLVFKCLTHHNMTVEDKIAETLSILDFFFMA